MPECVAKNCPGLAVARPVASRLEVTDGGSHPATRTTRLCGPCRHPREIDAGHESRTACLALPRIASVPCAEVRRRSGLPYMARRLFASLASLFLNFEKLIWNAYTQKRLSCHTPPPPLRELFTRTGFSEKPEERLSRMDCCRGESEAKVRRRAVCAAPSRPPWIDHSSRCASGLAISFAHSDSACCFQ
jgi:hypothetical protein